MEREYRRYRRRLKLFTREQASATAIKKRKKGKNVVASIERAKFKWESNNRKQIVRFIFRTNTDRSRGGASTKLDKIGGSNSFSTRGVELIIKRDTGIL